MIDDKKVKILREALTDLVAAVKKEIDEKPLLGVSGWLGARLSDARKALKDTE